ncbi:hypothetical protein HPB47_007453 [Ixodes persulcatus]|uniref:Uncharacterized protein n=1 Tax=Ixodes persulcatus TaxID=34615 RepID=A0AC60P7F8_IXOPE|nr:hypothetical protein HPB47_007453 [Ixodes persulcatus]
MEANGFVVQFQWPHKLIIGPPRSNHLTTLANIRRHIASLHLDKDTHYPCITKGLSRLEATTLLRLRTRSARTPAWLYKIPVTKPPLCSTCAVHCDQDHLLLHGLARTSSEQVERKFALQNPGILGSIPTPARYDLDEHRTCVRSCITTAWCTLKTPGQRARELGHSADVQSGIPAAGAASIAI